MGRQYSPPLPVAGEFAGSKMARLRPVRAGFLTPPAVHPKPEVPMSVVMEKKSATPTKNPFEVAQRQFDIAADALKLEEGIRIKLRVPRRCLIVSVPFEMDNEIGRDTSELQSPMYLVCRLLLEKKK